MSKNKDYSSKKDESDDCLTSYLNIKSPLMGQLEFDVSLLPPPVDPRFIDYEIRDDIIKYELTGLELSDRLSSFSDLNHCLSDDLLYGTSFTGCGVENKELMTRLESNFLENLNSKIGSNQSYLSLVRKDVFDTMKLFENLKLTSTLTKAKESLPGYLSHLLTSTQDTEFSSQKNIKFPKPDDFSPVDKDTKTPNFESWSNMSLDERIEAYVTELEKTFVSPNELVHPNNKFAKQVKVYNVLPNLRLWENRYFQVGIDGVTVNSDQKSRLDVDGVLKLAKETQTQRYFEYYRKSDTFRDQSNTNSTESLPSDAMNLDVQNDMDDVDDLFNETDEEDLKADSQPSRDDGELYTFIRQYTTQKYSKTFGTENYHLLKLPNGLMEKVDNSKHMGKDESNTVELVPIRGPKLVFSKAGVTKRPDIRIAYV